MRGPLSDLQGFLADTLRREAPVVESPELAGACAAHVTGNERLSPAEQVDIYRRQFWLRHIDSLREDYPGLEYVLGDEGFEAFTRGYLAAHPPRAASLRDLGADIIGFAEGYGAFPEGRRDAALEMVRYENSFVELFDGAEPPRLDPRVIEGLAPDAWETARIVLHPLLVRMRVEYPVHRIRLAARSGESPAIERAAGAIYLGIYRGKDLRILFDELEPLAYELLGALAGGEPLVPACDRIAAAAGEEAAGELQAKVGTWFQKWAAAGWIVGVEAGGGRAG